MTEKTNKATPDEKIVHHAKSWRNCDKDAIANKSDRDRQRAEYQARKQLRKVIDESED
jgi:hypothetical protein